MIFIYFLFPYCLLFHPFIHSLSLPASQEDAKTYHRLAFSPGEKRKNGSHCFDTNHTSLFSRSRLSKLVYVISTAEIIVRRNTMTHSWIRLVSLGHILMGFSLFLLFRPTFRLSVSWIFHIFVSYLFFPENLSVRSRSIYFTFYRR